MAKKKPLTASERDRRRRERINANPELREAYLAKKRQKAKEAYVKIEDRPEREQRHLRKMWRAKYKAKKEKAAMAKSALENTPPTTPEAPMDLEQITPEAPMDLDQPASSKQSPCTPQGDVSSQDLMKSSEKTNTRKRRRLRRGIIMSLRSQLQYYKTRYEKYKKRIQRMGRKMNEDRVVAETPRTKTRRILREEYGRSPKGKEVRRTLFGQAIVADAVRRAPTKITSTYLRKYALARKDGWRCAMALHLGRDGSHRLRNGLGGDDRKKQDRQLLHEQVKEFFVRDDNSRASAGKKEVVSKKGKRHQKRYLLQPINVLYQKFRSEGGKASETVFRRLRPFFCVHPRVTSRLTTACKVCANFGLMIKKAKYHKMVELSSKNEVTFRDFPPDDNVSWQQWEVVREEREVKGEKKMIRIPRLVEVSGTKQVLASSIRIKMDSYAEHREKIRSQFEAYRVSRQRALAQEGVLHIHVDFSENYSSKYEEEIQSVHFGAGRSQITLHTGVLYSTKGTKSFASVSDSLEHGPRAISAHLKGALETKKPKEVHFWSDSPTTQYRNAKNFGYAAGIAKEHECSVTWNFLAPGHGKGAADGISGAIKRNADDAVARGKSVLSATDFIRANTGSKVRMWEVTEDDICETQDPPSLQTKVKATMKQFQLIITDPETIGFRQESCFGDGDSCPFCDCISCQKVAVEFPRPDVADMSSDEEALNEDFPSTESSEDVSFSVNDDVEMTEPSTTSSITNGSFVLVKVLGGSRKKTEFRYACIVECQDEDGGYWMTGLQSATRNKDTFHLKPNDRFKVERNEIICELPVADLTSRGLYKFPGAIEAVKEM